ncbi:2-oxoglutarate dehydrogenase, E2 component, dihydrolipoamide succinyltransferase [Salinibacterium sp. M195]|uniref:2-oxoglutarate dehydrogenase, E2 component, dihydrolipoamide succinyltransferase n=1 Tax=Salinibacterium sp. M195 TaxID=2583374 RepID=UPI001C635CE6|nr:2-oxoglutarate dehydrogenase, E2 component, dihydrolipoamide succinyltransferase [Salinibacterium sp. M195]QYH36054.1 2-oxoglutarate dehydrogenase, E2 component, dihydrolipoamide succinyltransferase [Salinibacterium sp. M195]
MSESVNLPALGESVTEGTVTRWLKQVGDSVEVDEPLLEVSTDKVDTEIPSPVAGVIEEILVAEDETVEVGTALVRIGDGSGGSDAAPAAEAEPAAAEAEPETSAPAAEPEAAPAAEAQPVAETPAEAPAEEDAPAAPAQDTPVAVAPSTEAPAPSEAQHAAAPAEAAPVEEAPATETPVEEAPVEEAPATETPAAPAAEATSNSAEHDEDDSDSDDSQAGYLTPLVRKLANERGVDLSTITGTGVGGRIRKQDVLDASEKASSTEAEAAAPAAPVAREVSPLRGTTVPMSRLRKVIAERAVISMQSSAQLTSVVEVDVTAVANFRTSVKDKFLEKTGTKLSFLPFFALAAAEALTSNPIINATIEDNSIVYPAQENISIAVDTERGLLTPVIRDAASLDLAGLAGEIADLAQRTRDNKLTPDELSGGTFTLTNTGSRGALFDTPIVFLPQSAILGTGIVTKKPVVISDASGDSIGIRSMVYLALSYDHRIVDGADAARFLVDMKNRLEGGDFADKLGI